MRKPRRRSALVVGGELPEVPLKLLRDGAVLPSAICLGSGGAREVVDLDAERSVSPNSVSSRGCRAPRLDRGEMPADTPAALRANHTRRPDPARSGWALRQLGALVTSLAHRLGRHDHSA